MTFGDLVIQALQEIRVLAQGEVPSANDMADGLLRFNRMMDEWAAKSIMAFNVQFIVYTLTAGHSPTLIGPGLAAPDLAAPYRPIRIESAAWLLGTGSTTVDSPLLNIRDDAWWANQKVKGLTSTIATDLYYSPDFPNGSLYFWPIPTVSGRVRLETWTPLAYDPTGKGQQTAFSMPPGYWGAVVKNLALELEPAFEGAMVSDQLRMNARNSLKAIQGNNDSSPRIATAQPGMKASRRGKRADFNWSDGSVI